MGACFNKILGDCPMRINCATTWIDGDKQYLILGCEEGIFYVDANVSEAGELVRVIFFSLFSQRLFSSITRDVPGSM